MEFVKINILDNDINEVINNETQVQNNNNSIKPSEEIDKSQRNVQPSSPKKNMGLKIKINTDKNISRIEFNPLDDDNENFFEEDFNEKIKKISKETEETESKKVSLEKTSSKTSIPDSPKKTLSSRIKQSTNKKLPEVKPIEDEVTNVPDLSNNKINEPNDNNDLNENTLLNNYAKSSDKILTVLTTAESRVYNSALDVFTYPKHNSNVNDINNINTNINFATNFSNISNIEYMPITKQQDEIDKADEKIIKAEETDNAERNDIVNALDSRFEGNYLFTYFTYFLNYLT